MSWNRLRALAARADGCFNLDQALASGVSRSSVWRAASRGEVVHTAPNVFRFASHAATWRARLRSAVLAHPDVVASHCAAGRLHGWEEGPRRRPHVLAPIGCGLRLPGVTVHRTRSLEDTDLSEVDGIETTTPARTALDLAATTSKTNVPLVIDGLVTSGAVGTVALARRLDLPGGPLRHRGVVRDLVGPDGPARVRSALERQLPLLCDRRGLPRPKMNVGVVVRGQPMTVDAVWDGGIVAELLGLRFHDSPRQVDGDAERVSMLGEACRRVLLLTWRTVVAEPEVGAALIAHALEQAR